MDRKDEFRDRTSVARQNFVLSLFKDGQGVEEKIEIACRAGVSSPSEMASLVGTEVSDRLIEQMAKIHFQLPADFSGPPLNEAIKAIKRRDEEKNY